jgi:ribosomal-protein-alanine N-acetyltransferase
MDAVSPAGLRIDLHNGFYLDSVHDGDQAAYVEHFRDKDMTDRLLKVPFPYTDEDADKWVRYCLAAEFRQTHPHHFAFRRADGFLIGGIGLQFNSGFDRHRAELGYWLARNYRGRGLASAAVRAVVLYGFHELGLFRIQATSFASNVESHRVLERTGFVREGFLAAFHMKDGVPIDAHMFAILRS